MAACGQSGGWHCDSGVRAEHDAGPNGNSALATADQRDPKPTVLAGCLERGSGADEYALRGPRLHWWELKSDRVDLNLFLDEEVRLTVVKSPENDATLTVTDLTLVSSSCK